LEKKYHAAGESLDMDISNLMFEVKNVELIAAWPFMSHDEEQKNMFLPVLNLESCQDAALGIFSYCPRNMISKLP
jgi:hypothetical protein